jgi:outer membrane receptor protein involved in Fe transport
MQRRSDAVMLGAFGLAIATGVTIAEKSAAAQVEVPIYIEDDSVGVDTQAEGPLDEFIVQSATKRVESALETPQIVTVITAAQIKHAGYRTLNDVLNDIPGFESYHQKLFWSEGVRSWARGTPRTLLVLWNGVPLNTVKFNERSIGPEIPLAGIRRIEVVSGPGGVAWGANAFLGVVNLIPERAGDRDSAAEVTAQAGGGDGSPDAISAVAKAKDEFFDGKVTAALTLTYWSSKEAGYSMPFDIDFSPFRPPRDDGPYQLREFSGPMVTPQEHFLNLQLALDVGKIKIDIFYPLVFRNYAAMNDRGIRTDHSLVPDPTDPEHLVTIDSYNEIGDSWALASARYDVAIGETTHLETRLYYTGLDRIDFRGMQVGTGQIPPQGVVSYDTSPGHSEFLKDAEYRYGAAIDVTHDLGKLSLVYGAEVYREGMYPTAFQLEGASIGKFIGTCDSTQPDGTQGANPCKRNSVGAFANARFSFSKQFRVEAGGRFVTFPGSSIKNAPLGTVAMLWIPHANVFAKANFAMGYRPPTFGQLYRNDSPFTNPRPHLPGNADLESETSQAGEVELSGLLLQGISGIRYLRLAAGYQYTQLSNLITERTGRPENDGERALSTAELRADLRISSGTIGLRYGYFFGVDALDGPIRNVANHKLMLLGDLNITKQVNLSFGATVYGPREDANRYAVLADAEPRLGAYYATPGNVVIDKMPAFCLVRLGLTWEQLWGGKLDLGVYADNLLNVVYDVPDDDFEPRNQMFAPSAPGLSILAGATLRL